MTAATFLIILYIIQVVVIKEMVAREYNSFSNTYHYSVYTLWTILNPKSWHWFYSFYRVPECSFLKGIKWSNQTIPVHNLIGLVMYQTGSRPHLDMKQLLSKLSPRLSLNLGDFCFSFVFFWLVGSLTILLYMNI